MTTYLLVGLGLWLGFNVWFVWLRLRAAETKRHRGLEDRPHYSWRT